MTIELKKWHSISQKDLKILVLYQELKCEVRYFYLIFIIIFYMNLLIILINYSIISDLAKSGENPPQGFMAPKAWQIIADYYKKQLNKEA